MIGNLRGAFSLTLRLCFHFSSAVRSIIECILSQLLGNKGVVSPSNINTKGPQAFSYWKYWYLGWRSFLKRNSPDPLHFLGGYSFDDWTSCYHSFEFFKLINLNLKTRYILRYIKFLSIKANHLHKLLSQRRTKCWNWNKVTIYWW